MRQPNQSDLIYANQQILQSIEQNPIELETSSRSVWGVLGVPCAKAAGFYIANDGYDLTLCTTKLGHFVFLKLNSSEVLSFNYIGLGLD